MEVGRMRVRKKKIVSISGLKVVPNRVKRKQQQTEKRSHSLRNSREIHDFDHVFRFSYRLRRLLLRLKIITAASNSCFLRLLGAECVLNSVEKVRLRLNSSR